MIGYKILIVDDDPETVGLLEMICSPMGLICESAENGRAAIDVLKKKAFDLVITDMVMPEVDGMSLLLHIKENYPSTKVICITGYAAEHDFVRVINAGASDFIEKPFPKMELEAKLKRVFREKALLNSYQKEIESHLTAQQEVQRSYRTQEIINELLLLILEDVSLVEILNRFIRLLTDLPWLELQKKGAVFLAEGDPKQLVLKANYELAEPLLLKCATVPWGRCLCGKAAETNSIVFADCIDNRHDITFPGMQPHGHYCVPIVAPDGATLGVFTLYTVEHAVRNERFERTFQACAKVLAGVIRHKQLERELVTAKELSDQASIIKNSFLNTVSHELRTPMNGIIGFTELLKKSNLDPKQQNYIAQIEESSERMLTLVLQMIDLSELESRLLTQKASSFNMFELFDKLCALFEEKAAAKGIELSRFLDAAIPEELTGYSEIIFQVLFNLVDNAIKFTDQGLVDLSVRVEEVTTPNIVTLSFSVKDTGCGIPRKKQKIIFEAFTQAEDYMTRKHQGAGVGLALCAKLLKKVGGKIQLESAEQVGSTFRFTAKFTQ
jgi:signal transduction histidine kinase/CheY-like chemotaxis protein